MERQSYVIAATMIAGIVDFGVAWYLIPAHGAVGACIGSGAAQVTAIGLMWGVAVYRYKVTLPWMLVTKIAFISVLAALTAHFIAVQFAPLWGLLAGGIASLAVLFALFYLMRVLEPEDRARFSILTRSLPKRIAGPVDALLSLLIHPENASAVPTNS
jgi:peptidoglycan biosynthesis protein MviN/MurJ (putative lipid II flippase)